MKAQADLNLRWAHMSEGTFSDVESQFILICYWINLVNNYDLPRERVVRCKY